MDLFPKKVKKTEKPLEQKSILQFSDDSSGLLRLIYESVQKISEKQDHQIKAQQEVLSKIVNSLLNKETGATGTNDFGDSEDVATERISYEKSSFIEETSRNSEDIEDFVEDFESESISVSFIECPEDYEPVKGPIREQAPEGLVPAAKILTRLTRPTSLSKPSRKKIIKITKHSETHFQISGDGTYDAKDIIKKVGNASWASTSKSWLVHLNYITNLRDAIDNHDDFELQDDDE